MKIVVKMKNYRPMSITVNDTETGRLYFEITRNQSRIQPAFFRDSKMWTVEYMQQLAIQAKQAFGWDWLNDNYDLSISTKLHKDLENSVGQLGFDNIPEQYDNLLYDLHHCLHAIQGGPKQVPRPDNFQIEWLTDHSIELPASFEFSQKREFGDLVLINPYVGHNPLQIYLENDFSSLATTCKFHDVIKPGIVLSNQKYVSKQVILQRFLEKDAEFVRRHGAEKIIYYAGSAVVGRVDDIVLFKQIKSSADMLELESVEFYD